MKRVVAVVLAGGEGERLSILSAVRAKPAVPFAGKYRIIDFTLSNCVNSEIDNVLVLTQYNPRSLNDHIGAGRPWDLDRNEGGIRLLQPFIARGRASEWYRGTADAVLLNIETIRQQPGDIVVILAGDHIYKMDYQPFIQFHRRNRADVTVAVKRVPICEASRFGILALDDDGRVTEWQEKPKQPKSDLASLGIYVFSKKALLAWLDDKRTDFGRDVIPAMLDGGARVFGYRSMATGRTWARSRATGRPRWTCSTSTPSSTCTTSAGSSTPDPRSVSPARIGATANVHRIADQPRLPDLGHRRALGPVARRARRSGRHRARLDRHVRHGHPRRRGRRPGDHRQGGLGRAERHRRHWAPTSRPPISRSRAGSTPASPSSASAPSSRPASGSGAT